MMKFANIKKYNQIEEDYKTELVWKVNIFQNNSTVCPKSIGVLVFLARFGFDPVKFGFDQMFL